MQGRIVGPTKAVKEKIMGKVVSIERGKFLGDYISRQKASGISNGLFLLGVLATVVVPQVLYCAMGGPVAPWVLVVSAQAGVIIGLVKYIRPPAALASVVDMQTGPILQRDRTTRRKLS
jgi:hypothetical protein